MLSDKKIQSVEYSESELFCHFDAFVGDEFGKVEYLDIVDEVFRVIRLSSGLKIEDGSDIDIAISAGIAAMERLVHLRISAALGLDASPIEMENAIANTLESGGKRTFSRLFVETIFQKQFTEKLRR